MSTSTFTQNVKLCPDIGELQNGITFRVFPNPSDGEFTVEAEGIENAEFIIENLVGQVVHRQFIMNGKTQVKTGHLADGVYYYRVMKMEVGIVTGKIESTSEGKPLGLTTTHFGATLFHRYFSGAQLNGTDKGRNLM